MRYFPLKKFWSLVPPSWKVIMLQQLIIELTFQEVENKRKFQLLALKVVVVAYKRFKIWWFDLETFFFLKTGCWGEVVATGCSTAFKHVLPSMYFLIPHLKAFSTIQVLLTQLSQYICTGGSTCFLPPPELDFPPPESRCLAMDLTASRAESTIPCAVLGPAQTHHLWDENTEQTIKEIQARHKFYFFIVPL